jgi:hypothetical protein
MLAARLTVRNRIPMKRTLTMFALLACAGAAFPAGAGAAQSLNMKPGLWELDNRVSSSDPQIQSAMSEMQKQLANMSPQQRQSLQQMMDRNGVQLQLGDGGTIHSSVCMTREMIDRKTFPVQGGECSQNVTPLSGNRFKVAFSCTKPRARGAGEISMESDTSYRGRVQITSEERSGTVDMDVTGRWAGADCGGVKPMGVPRGK